MRQTKPLPWGARVSLDFRQKLLDMCVRLGWTEDHAGWLMACMAFETGRTFSPSVRNPASSATGLIQFMEATARGMGTSTRELARMPATQQLDYVEKYFRPNARNINSLEDMYMAILWPKGISQTLEHVLWKTGTRQYAVNRGLDKNRDGRVTKSEAAAKVKELYYEGLLFKNVA